MFDALAEMDVVLDADPIAFGPKRLNAKVAQCREYLSKCQRLYLQIADDLGRLNRAHRQSKLDFDLRMQDLFANDPDVRSGKNVRDREAVATMKLREEREAMSRLESSLQDLDAVLTVVKAKREDLKDIQGRIRDQVKLCQEEIGLGERWGSALPPGARPVNLDHRPRVDTKAMEDMNDILKGIEGGDTSVSDLAKFVKMETGEDEEEEEEEATLKSAEPEPSPEVPPEPEVVAEVAPDVEVDVEPEGLPEVQEVAPPAGGGIALDDVDALLGELEPTPSAPVKKSSSAPPQVSEVDIDDILGELVSS